jgi:hypothetical protein
MSTQSSETPKPLCKKCRGTGTVPLCPAELPTESGVFCPDCETGRQRWKAVLKFVDEIETKRPTTVFVPKRKPDPSPASRSDA